MSTPKARVERVAPQAQTIAGNLEMIRRERKMMYQKRRRRSKLWTKKDQNKNKVHRNATGASNLFYVDV